MYALVLRDSFEFMTFVVRILGNVPRHLYVLPERSGTDLGSARIAAFLPLPEVLAEFGVALGDVLNAAGVPADVFEDPDNLISYPDAGRLLAESVRNTNCGHVGLLVGQRSRLATMGLAGQVALCADTVGQGLQNFADFFPLQNTAATVRVVRSGEFARLTYAITEPGMGDTGQLQLGAMALEFNILRELCGPGWRPTMVTVASGAPSNLRPCRQFFRAPLRFDCEESAVVFESRWLDRPLPPVEPLVRCRVEAAVRERYAAMLDDFPRTVRRILRQQLLTNSCSMDYVAGRLGVHRRTLDRRLKSYGVSYGDVVESVKSEVACQLLRDTRLRMQQVAEALHYSSAANFSTAFRRWKGVTPTNFRRNRK